MNRNLLLFVFSLILVGISIFLFSIFHEKELRDFILGAENGKLKYSVIDKEDRVQIGHLLITSKENGIYSIGYYISKLEKYYSDISALGFDITFQFNKIKEICVNIEGKAYMINTCARDKKLLTTILNNYTNLQLEVLSLYGKPVSYVFREINKYKDKYIGKRYISEILSDCWKTSSWYSTQIYCFYKGILTYYEDENIIMKLIQFE